MFLLRRIWGFTVVIISDCISEGAAVFIFEQNLRFCHVCRAGSLSLMDLRSSTPTRMRGQQIMRPWTKCWMLAVAQECEHA